MDEYLGLASLIAVVVLGLFGTVSEFREGRVIKKDGRVTPRGWLALGGVLVAGGLALYFQFGAVEIRVARLETERSALEEARALMIQANEAISANVGRLEESNAALYERYKQLESLVLRLPTESGGR